MVVTIMGGLGLFLLGIHHLTEGLKGIAGDSLRRGLQRIVSGRLSAVSFGVFFTVVMQSSTAAILTTIGFVSAGLITFPQAIGVIIGATLGTTSTPWIVALFGLRFRISAAAMPILGIGALLWLIARGGIRSLDLSTPSSPPCRDQDTRPRAILHRGRPPGTEPRISNGLRIDHPVLSPILRQCSLRDSGHNCLDASDLQRDNSRECTQSQARL